MSEPQTDETAGDEPTDDDAGRPDAVMRTFGFIIAIALVLIAISFIVDFVNDLS